MDNNTAQNNPGKNSRVFLLASVIMLYLAIKLFKGISKGEYPIEPKWITVVGSIVLTIGAVVLGYLAVRGMFRQRKLEYDIYFAEKEKEEEAARLAAMEDDGIDDDEYEYEDEDGSDSADDE